MGDDSGTGGNKINELGMEQPVLNQILATLSTFTHRRWRSPALEVADFGSHGIASAHGPTVAALRGARFEAKRR